MLEALRRPQWLAAAIVVGLLAGLFVRLGIWQLDRLSERRSDNAVGQMRLQTAPTRLSELLAEAGGDLDEIEFRRVELSGEFEPEQEVLIRSQVELGQAGFHVITPLVANDGQGVLVNRGWVPLPMDEPPIREALPDPGPLRVEGWVRLSENRPRFGPEDAPGKLEVLNRVDVDRIAQQVDQPLAPVYVVLAGERGTTELPIPIREPAFTDEGPHLAYAIQWFGFALVGVVGLFFLIRRESQSPKYSSSD